MPTRRNPLLAHHHRNEVVELQCQDSRSPAGRQSDDLHTIVTPNEVIRPGLGSWIVERHDLAGQGIHSVRLIAFCIVAQTTGELEVFLVAASTL